MRPEQVDEIIDKLKCEFSRHRFNEPGVVAGYTRKLINLNYERMKEAIDKIIEEDSTEVPALSVLLQRYKGIGKNNTRTEIRNSKYCPTCHDRGFILLKEQVKVGEDEESNPIYSTYEFAYYCPFCSVGSQYEYDGRQCREWKTDYVMKPITEVLPEEVLNDMRKTNLKWKQQNEKSRAERNSKDVRSITSSIGRDMPEVHHYDEDFIPGDAYEGEELPV